MSNTCAFIGDPHLQFSNPSSRVDNYFVSVLNKLNTILEDNKYVVILGDMFSNPVLDIQGTMAVIQMLKDHQNRNGLVYSLVGNHDIYSWNPQTVTKTTLGLLNKLALIDIIDGSGQIELAMQQVKIEDWTIIPTDLKAPKEHLKQAKNDKCILVGHNFYANGRDERHSLEYEDLKELGYRYIFLGHDHEPARPKIIEGTTLYRPGSLGRESAQPFNFTRELIYYQLDIDSGEVKSVKVDCLPASEIFSLEVQAKRENKTPDYVCDLEDLIKSFKNKNRVNVSIRQLLEKNKEVPNEVFEFIKDCYEANNLEFI